MSEFVSDSDRTLLWSQAAALGSLWAAIEITAGSFLHNLRVPFAGALLAASGMVLMAAALGRWPHPGLIWRTATVCAFMKAISPSAFILGPMVGIFTEGLLFYLVVRLLGHGWAGCVLGGALAVSWALLQKIGNLLLQYGLKLIPLYAALVRFAARSTGWEGLAADRVLLYLFGAHALIGATAGAAGWWLGRPAGELPAEEGFEGVGASVRAVRLEAAPATSFVALALLVAGLVGGLWWLGRAGLLRAGVILAPAVAVVCWRYRRSLRRLARLRLWIELSAVLLLSGLLLGGLRGGENALTTGLLAGAEMTLRALFVVVMFSAIGVELRNPVLLAALSRRRFLQFRLALEAAFAAVPDFIAALQETSVSLRHPRCAVARLLDRAAVWQRSILESRRGAPVVLLTGPPGSGKTTLLMETAELLARRGRPAVGILAPGQWDGAVRAGYDLLDLATGRRRTLAQRSDAAGRVRCGPYVFHEEALRSGRDALAACLGAEAAAVFVDEVGLLELRGEGWARSLELLRSACGLPMVWTVRPALVDQVRRRWRLEEAAVLHVSETSPAALVELLTAPAVAGVRS